MITLLLIGLWGFLGSFAFIGWMCIDEYREKRNKPYLFPNTKYLWPIWKILIIFVSGPFIWTLCTLAIAIEAKDNGRTFCGVVSKGVKELIESLPKMIKMWFFDPPSEKLSPPKNEGKEIVDYSNLTRRIKVDRVKKSSLIQRLGKLTEW